MLRAMEDEHEQIDPALAAVTAGFAAMVEHPCADHRNALDVHVTSTRAALLDHLAHEESDALPFLQQVMSVEEYAACEKAAAGGYPLRLVPFLVPGPSTACPTTSPPASSPTPGPATASPCASSAPASSAAGAGRRAR